VTQQEVAAFMAAHPLEVVLAAFAVNALGIMGLAALMRWLSRK
jgi:hypothetical protein